MKSICANSRDLDGFAEKLLGVVLEKGAAGSAAALVVGLYGDLGAGKTTFTKVFAGKIGVVEEVSSPTFVLEKIYPISPGKFKRFIHIDAYRIEKSQELISLGWNEIVSDPANIIFIEWPERVADIMPANHIHLVFHHINETTREIEAVGI